MQYVEIAVNVPQVSGVFHYHAPSDLEGRLQPGQLVTVPFGALTVQGVILRPVETPSVSQTRAVGALLDEQAVLTPAQLAFAAALAEQDLSPLAAAIGLMLPPGLDQQADTEYRSLVGGSLDLPGQALTDLQQQLLVLLQRRGALRGRQIDRAIPRANWRTSVRSLVQRGVVGTRPVLPAPTVRPKFIRTAQLAVHPDKALAALPELGKTPATQERRARMLRFLLGEGVPVSVSWVYAHSGGSLADLQVLAELDLVELRETEIFRDPLEGVVIDASSLRPALTPDQETVWAPISGAIEAGQAAGFLLQGVTGSGKTEIYLRAVEQVLAAGKQALVLVPEISLTPQTVRRFMARFPGQVGLMHSRLSPGEQYDTWRRARRGDLGVIVGPRSALFAPLPDIGLIVLDESHDASYYQSEPPFYHACAAAEAYARQLKAVCIQGSATPSVESRYLAEAGRWRLLRLPRRILSGGMAAGGELPAVHTVDMRAELRAGNRSIFSRRLQGALAERLEHGEQAILFLNRRGTGTYVFCRTCGHSLGCPRCERAALTFHRSEDALLCHHCGYKRGMPQTCPNCKSPQIRHYGTGTEKVEAELRALFPQARSLRWDLDTTRQKGAHEMILAHFSNHQADVLVGTQMLAKGLDLPLVTLVGIVLADVGLHLPDFRAAERVFQTLTQVAGRAGRSGLGGEVVLQTFTPEHYAIRAAARHDVEDFTRQELARRREIGYPPFSQLARLEFRTNDAGRAEKTAQAMALHLQELLHRQGRRQTEIIGPAPCFYARLDGRYRWQILLRGPEPAKILAGLPPLKSLGQAAGQSLGEWRVELNPQSLL